MKQVFKFDLNQPIAYQGHEPWRKVIYEDISIKLKEFLMIMRLIKSYIS